MLFTRVVSSGAVYYLVQIRDTIGPSGARGEKKWSHRAIVSAWFKKEDQRSNLISGNIHEGKDNIIRGWNSATTHSPIRLLVPDEVKFHAAPSVFKMEVFKTRDVSMRRNAVSLLPATTKRKASC